MDSYQRRKGRSLYYQVILSVSLTSPGENTWYLSNSFSGISKGYLRTGSSDINPAKSPSCFYPTEL